MKNNKNLLFTIAIIILNATIFTDFLPYNTILKFIVIFLLLLTLMFKKNQKLKINKYIILMLIFSMFVLCNILFGGDISFIITFITNVIIMILLMQFEEFSRVETNVLSVMCIIHLFFSIFVEIAPTTLVNSIFSKIILSGYNVNFSWRIVSGINVGITKQPGVSAMYMVVLSAFFFAKIIKEKKKIKYIIGYILSIAVILLTTKRSAIIFSLLSVLILIVLFSEKRINIKSTMRFFILLLIGCLIFCYLNTRFELLSQIQNKNLNLISNNDISNGRFNIWKDSLYMFFQKPIFGIGLKSYYNLKGYDIHNTYIQFLVEMGTAGFLVFILSVGKIVKDCLFIFTKKYNSKLKNMKNSTIIGLYILIFLILYGFVGNTFIDYLPLSLFIISICMIINDYYY